MLASHEEGCMGVGSLLIFYGTEAWIYMIFVQGMEGRSYGFLNGCVE